jgi:hypothetical protein
MAHYAIIENTNNTVIEVITGVDETVTQTDLDGTQVGGSSEAWEQFYGDRLKNDKYYVKRCSYNATIRGKYPAIGDTYDPVSDHFVGSMPPPTIEPDDEQ